MGSGASSMMRWLDVKRLVKRSSNKSPRQPSHRNKNKVVANLILTKRLHISNRISFRSLKGGIEHGSGDATQELFIPQRVGFHVLQGTFKRREYGQ